MQDGFQKVYTVTEYDSGPRRGIADYNSTPHLFASLRNDPADDYDARMVLTRVAPTLFTLAMEDWAIWQRWEAAFHAGRATLESHPAMPDDAVRSRELKQLLAEQLVPDPKVWFCAIGVFRTNRNVPWDGKGFGPLEVAWTRLDDVVEPDWLFVPPRRSLNS